MSRSRIARQLELFPPLRPNQLWLIELKGRPNPLVERLGSEFFASVPKQAGVYRMRNERGEILYVGKAKCLRDRLRSYTYAHAENSSRKTLRLIHLIRSIEVEVVKDEQAALLRENQLLRELSPAFNVLNTESHTYLFAHLRLEKTGFTSHFAMERDAEYADTYGSFKGRGMVWDAHKALLRLMWMAFHDCRHGFELPRHLTNRRRLLHHLFAWPEAMPDAERVRVYRDLRRLFNGTSRRALEDLAGRLLERQDDLAPFTRKLIQEDIDRVVAFYERAARRNRRIKRELKLEDAILAQDQLDDFLVLAKSR